MIRLINIGRLFSGIKGVYNEINPSTLTGALDIIIIEGPDGSYKCGPFHVRFGKMGAINPIDKHVEVYVNGSLIQFLRMRLGKAGDAYFVENEENIIESDTESNLSRDETFASDIIQNYNIAGSSRKRRKARKDVTVSENRDMPIELSDFFYDTNRSNSPTFLSDNECDRRKSVQLCSCKCDTSHVSETECITNAPYTSCIDDQPSSNSILQRAEHSKSAENISLATNNLSGIYLDDLVTSRVDQNLKNSYIYTTSSKRSIDRYSSQDLILNSGYRSDTDLMVRLLPSYSLFRELKLSLCGGLTADSPISEENFCADLVTFEDFAKDPSGILSNPNLVVLFNGKYYNWSVVAPMLVSIISFQAELPYNAILRLEESFMPKKRERRKPWFSWGSKDPDVSNFTEKPEEKNASFISNNKVDTENVCNPIELSNIKELSNECDYLESQNMTRTEERFVHDSDMLTNKRQHKKKILTSEEVGRLSLKPGRNDIEFRIVTKFQGTSSCSASIFLWYWYDQLVISDVDGTITRSDLLGHFLPMLGRDWTHSGVAQLYTSIANNGYKFVYLSARALGQANLTRTYIQQVFQDNKFYLPDGPILLSSSSFFNALHREVIEGKPEIFKIRCLSEIHELFCDHPFPFFAAFGNRSNDVIAYTEAGIEKSRIFTVNPKGELCNEFISYRKSNYQEYIDLVEMIFPPLTHKLHRDSVREEATKDYTIKKNVTVSENIYIPDALHFSSYTFWYQAPKYEEIANYNPEHLPK